MTAWNVLDGKLSIKAILYITLNNKKLWQIKFLSALDKQIIKWLMYFYQFQLISSLYHWLLKIGILLISYIVKTDIIMSFLL